MNALPAPRPPIARLYQPGLEVSPSIRAFIVRDTRTSALAGKDLLNRYPASMHCSLSWVLEGDAEIVDSGGQQEGLRSVACAVSGCHTQPVTTRNLGDVHMFMVMFYPDAFHALFGLDLALLQNRFETAHDVLPPHGVALVDAVTAARSDAERVSLVEQFVIEHARTRPLSPWLRVRRMSRHMTLGVASRILGIGPRQLQRLALREVGLNLQTQVRLRRGERSFLQAQRRFARSGDVNLADHALESDYADQSHLARECKAQTGRTPLQLMRDVQSEEADWVFRLEFADDDDPEPAALLGAA
jgi:AraC-like DNA-binding protein